MSVLYNINFYRASALIISGGVTIPEKGMSEAESTKKELGKFNLTTIPIILETHSKSTIENLAISLSALYLNNLILENGRKATKVIIFCDKPRAIKCQVLATFFCLGLGISPKVAGLNRKDISPNSNVFKQMLTIPKSLKQMERLKRQLLYLVQKP
jgi:hypothetical protein